MSKQEAGYTSKEPKSNPPIEKIDTFDGKNAATAARFGVGAANVGEIQHALEQRREHNESLSEVSKSKVRLVER